MKKLFLSLIAITTFLSAAHAQVRYGSEAGLTIANQLYTYNTGTANFNSTNPVFGAKAGEILDFPITPHWAIQPGLFASMLGYGINSKNTDSSSGPVVNSSIKSTTYIYYIQLPLHFLYRKEKWQGQFFVSAGPYIGYAVYGRTKYSASATVNGKGQQVDSTLGLSFGTSATDNMRAPDFGFGGSIGYEFPSWFFVRLGYDLSLSNLSPITDNGSIRNSCFHLTMGYFHGFLHRKHHQFHSGRVMWFRPPYNKKANP